MPCRSPWWRQKSPHRIDIRCILGAAANLIRRGNDSKLVTNLLDALMNVSCRQATSNHSFGGTCHPVTTKLGEWQQQIDQRCLCKSIKSTYRTNLQFVSQKRRQFVLLLCAAAEKPESRHQERAQCGLEFDWQNMATVCPQMDRSVNAFTNRLINC